MKRPLFSILLLLLFSSCSSSSPDGKEINNKIPVPEVTNDGWETASLESVGMDPEYFVQLLDRLEGIENHRIHGIVVAKDQKLVFEKYYSGKKFNLGQYTGETGYDMNDLHVLCSATKSVTSALLGIAMDKGYIDSVEREVFDYFPEYADLLEQSPLKANMTIKHLLTMTSGLTYDDESLPYTDPRNDMYRFFASSDPINFLLAKPLFAAPGAVFDYDNCNTNIIGQIINKATQTRVDTFAKEYLFDKLGIERYEWQIVKDDVILCSGDLHLRPRDMAKFGLLYLNGGTWKGERIISSGWCDVSTALFLNPNNYNNEFPWADGYGYQWWRKTYYVGAKAYASFFATGWGGQNIIIIPILQLVVVTTAGNWYDPEAISPFSIVSDYIIPSVKD
jgi:CubicO group peptidase (beta-lactamase class C family)